MDAIEILFPAKGRFETRPLPAPAALGPQEVRGPTLGSLISPGTELAWAMGDNFPLFPGYAAVFRAEEIGSAVSGIAPGDVLLCMGPHRSVQQIDARFTVQVPQGLAVEQALLARLLGVSMTTLMTTCARPGDRVIVCGAGPVGVLAAQLFALAGYEVDIVEPDATRRELALSLGIARAHARVPVDDPGIAGRVALVIDCSGHEQSVLDGCKVVRQGGEVVLIGVPWKRHTDLSAHALLDLVFRNFIVLRSGWEWALPLQGRAFKWEELLEGYNNSPQTVFAGFEKALRWLAAGRFDASGQILGVDPRDPARAYGDLLERRTQALFVVFDWTRLQDAA